MNVLIVQAYKKKVITDGVVPPMGIVHLAGYLRARARYPHQIKLIDMALDFLTVEQVVEQARRFQPGVIGIGARTVDALTMHKLAQRLREVFPGVSIIVGGPHPTAIPQAVLSDPSIDCVVVGEGEVTFTELVDRLEVGENWEGVAGCVYKKDGELVYEKPRPFIQDLDSLPFPAWDLLDLAGYSDGRRSTPAMMMKGHRYVTLMTTRGCPHQCIYCHRVFGKRFRAKSPERVVEEIIWMNQQFGIDDFHIWDDFFNLDLERARTIFRLVRKTGRKLHFAFPNALRLDAVDKETIEVFEQGGTYFTGLAVESASPRIQKLIKKNLDLDVARQAIELVSKSKILGIGYFMIGFPTETVEEIEATIRFAVESKIDGAFFFRVLPFPGTELHRMVRGNLDDARQDWDEFRYVDNRFDESTNCSDLPGEKIVELQQRAWRTMRLQPSRTLRVLRKTPPRLLLTGVKRNILWRLEFDRRTSPYLHRVLDFWRAKRSV